MARFKQGNEIENWTVIFLKCEKKHNLDTRSDSFGSSDTWITKTFGGNNGGGGGILNQEGNNGGGNGVLGANPAGVGADVDMGGDMMVIMMKGMIKNWVIRMVTAVLRMLRGRVVARTSGGENVAVPDGGLVVPHHVADDVSLGGDGGGLVPGDDVVVPRVVDDDRPVILALPAQGHQVLPVVLGLPARDAGGVMQPGDIGGDMLQPGSGGGGEIPIAAHAIYFPPMVVVAVSVASLLAYRLTLLAVVIIADFIAAGDQSGCVLMKKCCYACKESVHLSKYHVLVSCSRTQLGIFQFNICSTAMKSKRYLECKTLMLLK
nr:hypothetical protein [Tanacetum cinerariifolium]